MDVVKLNKDSFYELRDLLTTVFTKRNKRETDFEKLFPRIFGELNEYSTSSHYGVFEDGKLIGTAAMYSLDYVVGGEHIKLIANGNVAVHELYRGKGVMSAILKKINEECDKCADLCYLHGDPVRYGRFGYYEGETEYLLVFEPNAVAEYFFRPMQDEDVPALQKLSESKVEYIKRKECDFIPALNSRYRQAISVFDKEENLVGYMSYSEEDKHVEEFAFVDEIEHEVFGAFAKANSDSIEVLISGYDKLTYERLKEFATTITKEKEEPTLFRVVNPKRMREIAQNLGLNEELLYAPYLT